MNSRITGARIPLLVAALALGLSVGGCQIVGAVASKTVGEPEQKAQYVPTKVPTLVLAENFRSPSSAFVESDQLARYVTEELNDNKVAPTVDPLRPQNIATTRPAEYRAMSIAKIGCEAGAAQVIYIDVRQTEIDRSAGEGLTKAHGAARVKLIDAVSGKTLWPDDLADGFPVEFDTPMSNPSSEARLDTNMHQSVQQTLAVLIGRLFYDYKPD